MGCLTYTLRRIGGIASSLTRVDGGISSSLAASGCGMQTGMSKVSGMSSCMGLVCTPSIRIPYLEIEPELIWVTSDDISTNDVFSNTYWIVR